MQIFAGDDKPWSHSLDGHIHLFRYEAINKIPNTSTYFISHSVPGQDNLMMHISMSFLCDCDRARGREVG